MRGDALLSHFYPGIANYDYLNWPDWVKQTWLDNIPFCIAELDAIRRSVDVMSPDGLYNAPLERTGNKELADKVKTEFITQIESARAIKAATRGR